MAHSELAMIKAALMYAFHNTKQMAVYLFMSCCICHSNTEIHREITEVHYSNCTRIILLFIIYYLWFQRAIIQLLLN